MSDCWLKIMIKIIKSERRYKRRKNRLKMQVSLASDSSRMLGEVSGPVVMDPVCAGFYFICTLTLSFNLTCSGFVHF